MMNKQQIWGVVLSALGLALGTIGAALTASGSNKDDQND